MKNIQVSAAIIIKQINNQKFVLATQRAYGEFKGGWEFPGGKVEEGEDPKRALLREIKEELDADITIIEFFDKVEYGYPNFILHMNCYIAELNSNIKLIEHKDAKWLKRDELFDVEWLPADIDIVNKLKTKI